MISAAPLSKGLRRYSVRHFLMALVTLLVVTPFLDQFALGGLLESLLLTVVLLSAVTAVGGRSRTLATAALLVTPALVTHWLDRLFPQALPQAFSLVTAIIFAGYIVNTLLLFIFRAPRVNDEVLCAAVGTFLMMGLWWAFAYRLTAQIDPHSFVFTVDPQARTMTALEALYFSFGTLTNYYGDIIPTSRLARTLAMVQAVAGLFYFALLISRLVSLYSTESYTSESHSDG